MTFMNKSIQQVITNIFFLKIGHFIDKPINIQAKIKDKLFKMFNHVQIGNSMSLVNYLDNNLKFGHFKDCLTQIFISS